MTVGELQDLLSKYDRRTEVFVSAVVEPSKGMEGEWRQHQELLQVGGRSNRLVCLLAGFKE